MAGPDLDDTVLHSNNRNIEGAATEVIDEEGFVFEPCGLACPVGKGGGSGFVDDTKDFQAGELSGVLGGESLALVEKSGHGDDRLGHGLAQMSFGGLFQLTEDQGTDFLGPIRLAAQAHLVIGAHQSLDRKHGIFRGRGRLVFGSLADDQAAGRIDPNGAGHGRLTTHWNDGKHAILNHGDGRIGGAEVNTDDNLLSLSHDWMEGGE